MTHHDELKIMLTEIRANQEKQSVRMQRMERKLLGDREFGDDGMIDDVKELKKYVEKDKLNKAKQTGIVIGISAAAGGFGAWLKSIFGL